MMLQAAARAFVAEAFQRTIGRAGNLTELQCLQAIAILETGLGSSWKGPGVGSFNQGAIQRGGWPGAYFEYTDTHPKADGTSVPYKIGFRKYANEVEGFADLCRVVYVNLGRGTRVLPFASAGDLVGFSTGLHQYPCYYEGFGATDAERIAHHHAAVVRAIHLQAVELGEPEPQTAALPVTHPALFLGCKGPAVGVWQAKIGVKVDEEFGALTQAGTRAFQVRFGLPSNGIVGMPELIAAGLAPKPENATT
jgi:peptidoglycan hydrolase-like protein with peptidoglycan-binding domain